MPKYIFISDEDRGFPGDTLEEIQEEYDDYDESGTFKYQIENGLGAVYELGPKVAIKFKIEVLNTPTVVNPSKTKKG